MYSFPVAVSECAFQGPFSSGRSCEAASRWLESASAQDFYFLVSQDVSHFQGYLGAPLLGLHTNFYMLFISYFLG